jgi:hypothetical protein
VTLLVFKTSGPPEAGGGFDSRPPPPPWLSAVSALELGQQMGEGVACRFDMVPGHAADRMLAARRRRFEPRIVARLQALAEAKPEEAMALLLAEREAAGMPAGELAQHLGATPEEIRLWSRESGAAIYRTGTVIAGDAVATLERGLIAAIERARGSDPSRPGVSRDWLHRQFPAPAPAVVNEILAALVQRRALASTEGLLRLSGFVPGGGRC